MTTENSTENCLSVLCPGRAEAEALAVRVGEEYGTGKCWFAPWEGGRWWCLIRFPSGVVNPRPLALLQRVQDWGYTGYAVVGVRLQYLIPSLCVHPRVYLMPNFPGEGGDWRVEA